MKEEGIGEARACRSGNTTVLIYRYLAGFGALFALDNELQILVPLIPTPPGQSNVHDPLEKVGDPPHPIGSDAIRTQGRVRTSLITYGFPAAIDHRSLTPVNGLLRFLESVTPYSLEIYTLTKSVNDAGTASGLRVLLKARKNAASGPVADYSEDANYMGWVRNGRGNKICVVVISNAHSYVHPGTTVS